MYSVHYVKFVLQKRILTRNRSKCFWFSLVLSRSDPDDVLGSTNDAGRHTNQTNRMYHMNQRSRVRPTTQASHLADLIWFSADKS